MTYTSRSCERPLGFIFTKKRCVYVKHSMAYGTLGQMITDQYTPKRQTRQGCAYRTEVQNHFTHKLLRLHKRYGYAILVVFMHFFGEKKETKTMWRTTHNITENAFDTEKNAFPRANRGFNICRTIITKRQPLITRCYRTGTARRCRSEVFDNRTSAEVGCTLVFSI